MHTYMSVQESLLAETAFDDKGAEDITSNTRSSVSSLEIEVDTCIAEYRLIIGIVPPPI